MSMILSIHPSVAVPRWLGCDFNVYDRKSFIIVVTSKSVLTEANPLVISDVLSVAWRILDLVMFAVFPSGKASCEVQM